MTIPTRLRPAIVGAVVLTVIVLTAYGWYLLQAISLKGECGDEVRGKSVSPDGRVLATFYVRNCGATTGYSSIVTLRSARARFNPDDDFAALVIEDECDIRISWPAATTLLLEYPAKCEVFRRESRWRDIEVSFQPK